LALMDVLFICCESTFGKWTPGVSRVTTWLSVKHVQNFSVSYHENLLRA
jgi:hypothetical protein